MGGGVVFYVGEGGVLGGYDVVVETGVVVFELVFEEFDFELFLADMLEDDEGGGHQDEDGYDSGG